MSQYTLSIEKKDAYVILLNPNEDARGLIR
jgi:hypothetical protein